MSATLEEVQASMLATFDRAVNAAVDVAIYKETGVKQGAIAGQSVERTPLPYTSGPSLLPSGTAGAMPSWVVPALLLVAGAFVAFKLAKG